VTFTQADDVHDYPGWKDDRNGHARRPSSAVHLGILTRQPVNATSLLRQSR
jgi:hypothetical protein